MDYFHNSNQEATMARISFKSLAVCLLALGLSTPAHAADVEIQAGIFGGTLYQMSYALTEVLKVHAPEIKANAVETNGTGMGIIKASQAPERRIVAGTLVPVMEARAGVAPYKQAFTGLKLIGNMSENIQTLISFDPNIKTIEDLKGKRVGLGPKPTVLGHNHASIIMAASSDPKSIDFEYMNWGSMRDAMLDGSIDAMILGVSSRQTPPWVPVSVYGELIASRGNPHYIDIPEEAVKKASEADKIAYECKSVPAGSIGDNVPAKDIASWRDLLGLYAFDELDEQTAYTIAKVLYENCEEMATYSAAAKGIWPELIVPTVPDDMIHPGALRFYKEKGLR